MGKPDGLGPLNWIATIQSHEEAGAAALVAAVRWASERANGRLSLARRRLAFFTCWGVRSCGLVWFGLVDRSRSHPPISHTHTHPSNSSQAPRRRQSIKGAAAALPSHKCHPPTTGNWRFSRAHGSTYAFAAMPSSSSPAPAPAPSPPPPGASSAAAAATTATTARSNNGAGGGADSDTPASTPAPAPGLQQPPPLAAAPSSASSCASSSLPPNDHVHAVKEVVEDGEEEGEEESDEEAEGAAEVIQGLVIGGSVCVMGL